MLLFFFKQKTVYELGLGIPAKPLFRSIAAVIALNVDGMNIISNDGSNKLNSSRKARVSYKVQRTINASQIGRASFRETVQISFAVITVKKKVDNGQPN